MWVTGLLKWTSCKLWWNRVWKYTEFENTFALFFSIESPSCFVGNYSDEPTCGRPLGMKFDPDGYLVVCDAYLGLFRVDVDTGEQFSASMSSHCSAF